MGTKRRVAGGGRWQPTRRDLPNAPFGNIVGQWYRFDRYEVRDGYIRPVPGAGGGEYDPWASFRARHRREEVECPTKLWFSW